MYTRIAGFLLLEVQDTYTKHKLRL